MSRRIVLIVLTALLAAAGCSSDAEKDETTRDDSGEVVGEGDVGALSLQVGDCVSSGTVGSVTDVPVVPCDESHESEVFAVFDLPDGDYPGQTEATNTAQDECTGPRFEEYVGLSYDQSIFGVTFLIPTQQTWDQIDDREIVCLAGAATGESLTGSVQGRAE